jgi:polyhydroxyalkanoate synthesis repressor PhaR
MQKGVKTMSSPGSETIRISRYPNRRFYDHSTSSYVSLENIEELVHAGKTVEIRDSQSDEDLTRSVLARIIIERQPDKMQLFPVDMLHFIVRSNDVMSEFLRDYFRHSLPYLDYLQRHSAAAVNTLVQPMHWIKAWLERMVPQRADEHATPRPPSEIVDHQVDLSKRISELEARLRQLESSAGSENANLMKAKADIT